MSAALPTIVTDFGISVTTGQWLTSIFQLVMGVMVPWQADRSIAKWKAGRTDRKWRQVLVAATEQSRRSWSPELGDQ